MKKCLLLVSTILLFLSCDSNDSFINKESEKLLGTWVLKLVITEPDLVYGPPSNSEVTITFENQLGIVTFNGQSTCNQYSGKTLILNIHNIDLSEFHSTEIGCPNTSPYNFEGIYYDWLSKVNHYNIVGNELTLYFHHLGDFNNSLVFERQ